jgi:hypothetical protein
MPTSQQEADIALARWQALRDLPPESRIDVLMAEFFQPPPESDFLYEMTLRDVAFEMAA